MRNRDAILIVTFATQADIGYVKLLTYEEEKRGLL